MPMPIEIEMSEYPVDVDMTETLGEEMTSFCYDVPGNLIEAVYRSLQAQNRVYSLMEYTVERDEIQNAFSLSLRVLRREFDRENSHLYDD